MIESSSASVDKTEGAKPSGMQVHINCIYILSQGMLRRCNVYRILEWGSMHCIL